MSLKNLYNDICNEIVDRWQSEHKSPVKLSYFADIFNTSEETMKVILLKNPEMTEILPDLWTRKKYVAE